MRSEVVITSMPLKVTLICAFCTEIDTEFQTLGVLQRSEFTRLSSKAAPCTRRSTMALPVVVSNQKRTRLALSCARKKRPARVEVMTLAESEKPEAHCWILLLEMARCRSGRYVRSFEACRVPSSWYQRALCGGLVVG